MKKITSIFVAILFASFFIVGCQDSESDNTKVNTKDTVEETNLPDPGEMEEGMILTEELTFVSATALEGEADLSFETAEGGGVNFYVNYMSENAPDFEYMFIGEDGMTANPELVGKKFDVEFKYVDNVRTTVEGKEEGSNQIIKIKMK